MAMIFHATPHGSWIAIMDASGIRFNPDEPDAETIFAAMHPELYALLKSGDTAKAELAAVRAVAEQTQAERAIMEVTELRQKYRLAVRSLRFLAQHFALKDDDAIVTELRKMLGARAVDIIFRETI